VTLSLVNLDPTDTAKVDVDIRGLAVREARGRVITARSMDARPEFGQDDPLKPNYLDRIAVRRGVVSFVAPAKSVVVLELR
jgi:alpha-L-arabinofuranosidase